MSNIKRQVACLLVLAAMFQGAVLAQTGAKKPGPHFRNAEKEYNDQHYTNAIPLYHASLESGHANDSLAMLHLAACYWRIKRYDSATVFYRRYEKQFTPLYTTHQRLAELLAVQEQYDMAADTYHGLLNDVPLRNEKMLKPGSRISVRNSFVVDWYLFPTASLKKTINGNLVGMACLMPISSG